MLQMKALKDMGLDSESIDLIVSFSHWTHKVTEGYLMIVDLQGALTVNSVNGKMLINLTDPAIHCRDTTRFRPMNLG